MTDEKNLAEMPEEEAKEETSDSDTEAEEKNPEEEAAEKIKTFICVELNMGQMAEDVELAIRCRRPVERCNRVGGMIPAPEEVLAAIRKANEEGGR